MINLQNPKVIASIVFGIASASLIFFVAPWARPFFDYQLGDVALFTFGNLIGGLGVFFAIKMYRGSL